jgi:hypothetical protein
MLKKPIGYDEVPEEKAMPKLPRGNYICVVKQAEEGVSQFDTSKHLIRFMIDIWEGDYQNFYATKLEHESFTDANAKWKGYIDLMLPLDQKKNETDDQLAERTASINRFKRNIGYFEEANEGFHFDWDSPKAERQFEGLIVGVKFQPNTYDFDGKTGEWQKPKYFCSVNKIRDGSEKLLELYDKASKSAAAEPVKYTPKSEKKVEINEEDLPF